MSLLTYWRGVKKAMEQGGGGGVIYFIRHLWWSDVFHTGLFAWSFVSFPRPFPCFPTDISS